MGMFDYVYCEHPLPLPEEVKDFKADFKEGVEAPLDWSKFEFQSKDFAGLLEKYTIEEDGQIYKEIIEREIVGNESDFPDIIEKSGGIEKVEHTGEVYFYGLHMDKKYDHWIEFKALFWKGDLKEIYLEEYKKEDNSRRVASQEKILKTVKEAQKKQSRWSQRIKSYYNLIVRFIAGCGIKLFWVLQRIFTVK
ncbi:hypothetical protein CL634_08700 [bacterium]|nr:hypothetical protein [bacterium]